VDTKGILRVGVDNTPVTFELLKQKLSESVAKTPDLRLAISADKDAPWGQVVRVMDAAKEANVKQGNVKAFIKQAVKS
jgi:biopolymer transport protein ExbD